MPHVFFMPKLGLDMAIYSHFVGKNESFTPGSKCGDIFFLEEMIYCLKGLPGCSNGFLSLRGP